MARCRLKNIIFNNSDLIKKYKVNLTTFKIFSLVHHPPGRKRLDDTPMPF